MRQLLEFENDATVKNGINFIVVEENTFLELFSHLIFIHFGNNLLNLVKRLKLKAMNNSPFTTDFILYNITPS